MSRAQLLLVAAVVGTLALAGRAAAIVSTEAPSSLLVFPLVSVDAAQDVDTEIRLTNTGSAPQAVRCVYVDGSLAPGSASDFRLLLTAGQPVAWLASEGAVLAMDAGSVPAVPTTPFTGVLRCVAADAEGIPVVGDVLVGNATVLRGTAAPDSAAYAATGFAATGATADAPTVLVLGGAQAEYDACPESLALQPFLDDATVALGADSALERTTATTIALATCSSDPVGGASATVGFRLVNELGQTFTSTRAVREHLVSLLSHLDTNDSSRSIFNAGVAGTATGNIRLTPSSPGSAVLAVVLTGLSPAGGGTDHRVTVQPQLLGERGAPGDLIDLAVPTVTPASCPGDCNADGTVAINELITGVNIALGSTSLTQCPVFDTGGDGTVAINEIIAAVNAALNGCPEE